MRSFAPRSVSLLALFQVLSFAWSRWFALGVNVYLKQSLQGFRQELMDMKSKLFRMRDMTDALRVGKTKTESEEKILAQCEWYAPFLYPDGSAGPWSELPAYQVCV